MLPTRVDVAVIGAGAVGSSIAYHLARAGLRVAVLERGEVAGGASFGNPGAVSLATKKPGVALELAKVALDRFKGLAGELDHDIEFERCGALMVAETEAELAFLVDLAAKQRSAGAPVEVLNAQGARRVCPILGETVIGGAYCAIDGQVNPLQLTRAFARAAERLGAHIATDTTVRAIDVDAGRVCAVHTADGRILCDWVVNAAGCEVDLIARMVGVAHGVTPRRGQLLILASAADLPAVKVSTASQLLAKHLGDTSAGRLSFGYALKIRSGSVFLGSTNEAVGFDRTITEEAMTWIATSARRLMPRLASLQPLRKWAGLRPYREGGPIIGRCGGPEGYVAAAGHGGDGVALSPVIGAYVVDVIVRGRADLSMRSLDVAAVTN
jgi:glycine/D-amino acid oxidase-like deaminating enzyme